MADCSKTADFFREVQRIAISSNGEAYKDSEFVLMFEGGKRGNMCIYIDCAKIEDAIKDVQRWSDENPEIKRCAHCGDVAKLFWDHGYRFVSCDGCGIRTGNYDTAAYAIDVWNKRADVRKRGKWVYTGRGNSWECTHCNSCLDMSDDENGHARYCPQCGANMRGGAADE